MKACVLVVEDNPANRALMEYLLQAFGYRVVSAADGARGIEAAGRERPDVILMDLQMPNMNGFDAARELKSHPVLSRIPIVAVTAFAMVGDRDKVLAHGFDGYIAKPIAPETFVTQVEAFLKPGTPSASATPVPSADQPPARANTERVVLVVDNSPVNLALVRSTLEPFGYRVITAASAREGLHVAREQLPNVILSDVHMPGQSGYDLIRLVKGDDRLRRIPFVFISSTVWGEKERESGLALGAHRFILRPIEPAALIAEIEAVLADDGHDSDR